MLPRLRAGFAAFSERLEALFDRERERLALWIPVGLGLGISAWFVLPRPSAWAGFILLCLALCAAFLGVAGSRRWGRGLAIFTLVAALGCGLIWLRSERVEAPRLERPVFAQFNAGIEAGKPARPEERSADASSRCRFAPPVQGPRQPRRGQSGRLAEARRQNPHQGAADAAGADGGARGL